MWPPRSPDLTPLNFYLWGHTKQIVYSTLIRTKEELLQNIIAAGQIKDNHIVIKKQYIV